MSPGAFAEVLRIPERNLVPVPEGFDLTKAAPTEPLAVSYHAVNHAAHFLPLTLAASRCAVLGAGAIGLGCALVLAMHGARDIYIGELNDARREAAIAAGNGRLKGYVPDTSDAPSESSIDFVIDAVGAVTTRREASRITKPGSVIVHVGLLPGSEGLDVRKVTLQEITFTGSYCYTPQDFRETLDAMTSGRLGALNWFEERPIAKGTLAFHDLDEGRVSAAKVVLRP